MNTHCQEAFDALKAKLTAEPVLAYPAFDQDFVLETDDSIPGPGSSPFPVLNGKSHSVAYASCALLHHRFGDTCCGVGYQPLPSPLVQESCYCLH